MVLKGGGGGHKASVSDCLPLAAPLGLSPLLILTLQGPERVLVVSTEPLDDLSCLTTPGVGCPRDGLLPVPLTVDQVHPDAHSETMLGLPTPALTCVGVSGGGGGVRTKTHRGVRFLDKIMILQGVEQTIQSLEVGYANRAKRGGRVMWCFPLFAGLPSFDLTTSAR